MAGFSVCRLRLAWPGLKSFGGLVGRPVRFFRVCLVVIVLLFLSVCVRCVAERNILRLVHITLRPLASTMFGV